MNSSIKNYWKKNVVKVQPDKTNIKKRKQSLWTDTHQAAYMQTDPTTLDTSHNKAKQKVSPVSYHDYYNPFLLNT